MENSKKIFVSVTLGGETLPVGILWCYNRKGRESAAFEYDKQWLAHPKQFALEPALRLTEGTHYTDKSLFGSIGDSAPDRWGRVLMRRANRTGRTLSEADYLLGVNDEAREGALRFSDNYGGPYLAHSEEKPIPPLIKLPQLLSAAEKFMDDSETAADLKLLLAPGSSLGGARPKASVIDKGGALAIAKFPRKDDENDVVRWEAVALALTQSAGIKTQKWRLEKILDKYVLIVKRFDRTETNRIPFLSAMAMLNASANDGILHCYTELADSLLRYGAHPENDLEELWRRMAFEIMISSTDNHLRNHGFLYNNAGWTLSPAYDINPNTDKNVFATPIDSSGENNNIDLAMKNAANFKVSNQRAKEILEQVKNAVTTWRETAKKFKLPERSIERMRAAFKV